MEEEPEALFKEDMERAWLTIKIEKAAGHPEWIRK